MSERSAGGNIAIVQRDPMQQTSVNITAMKDVEHNNGVLQDL